MRPRRQSVPVVTIRSAPRSMSSMRNRISTAARDGVRPNADAVFYGNPIALARVLGSLFLLVSAQTYAALFFQIPVDQAKPLFLPLLSLIGVGVVCETAFAFLLSRLSPIRIGNNGTTLTDFWGRRRTLSRGEIKTVTPGNCLSLSYLKVSLFRKDRTALLLPTVVTRPQEYPRIYPPLRLTRKPTAPVFGGRRGVRITRTK